MQTFAGIDWGGSYHQLAVVDDHGCELFNERVAHTTNGLDVLVAELRSQTKLGGVAIERSEGLLVERLLDEGFDVIAVSPRVSARARERHQAATPKNDRFDAFVLPDLLRTDGWKWRPLTPPSPLQAELRAVTRHRRQCYETQVAVEAQLRETLIAYHPGVVALFSSVDRDATLVERLRMSLLAAADGSIAGHGFAALALADQLELLNNQLRAYNRRLGDILDQHPDFVIVDSFPAVGRTTAAELLAEIG